MNIEHFIITRFCCRKFEHNNDSKLSVYENALDADRIETRLMLLEMISMPSLLAQTYQNFKWIIVIDHALDQKYVDKLETLTSARSPVFLHRIAENEELTDLDWLEDYFTGVPSYVLTTNLDDDDAVPNNFCEKIHSHIVVENESSTLPPIKFFGYKNTVQWNMKFTPRYPFGTLSPWPNRIPSCGFSLGCKYPEYNLGVLNFLHALAEYYLEDKEIDESKVKRKKSDHVYRRRNMLKRAISINNQNYETDFKCQRTFHDISCDTGANLMSNHYFNVAANRLEEKKTMYLPVTGPECFPGLAVDWKAVVTYASVFQAQFVSKPMTGRYWQWLREQAWYDAFSWLKKSICEPTRLSRRLLRLRGYGNDKTNEIFPRSPGTDGS